MSRYCAAYIAVWTVIIALLTGSTIYFHHVDTLEEAQSEARNYFALNQFYRRWAARLGGVYAPADKVAPNPYLITPRRDVTTSDGTKLTLVNPAYMTRMVFDAIRQASPRPVISKLISLKPLNPVNKADPWESAALSAFETGASQECSQFTTIDGKPYLRFIARFTAEKPCLTCHAIQGYREGDVRGGITISIPLDGYYASEFKTRKNLLAGYLALWMTGTIGIALSSRRRGRYEDQLRAGEEKFRTICDWTQDWEYWIGPDDSFKYVSPSCTEITGYPPQAFMDDPGLVMQLVHPEDRPTFQEHLDLTLPGRQSYAGWLEFRIVARDGTVRWMHHACRPVHMGERYQGRRVSNRDVTEQKLARLEQQQASAALKESERTLRVLIDVIQAGIIQLDAEGVVSFANQRMAEMLGLPLSELVGREYRTLVGPEEVEEAMQSLKKMLNGETEFVNCERQYLRADGSQFWGYLTGRRLTNAEGDQAALVGTVTDLTELKTGEEKRLRIEQQMLHVQKLESLGVLAGGIAHDFNNILLAIMGNASLALHRLPSGSPVEHHLKQIEVAADKAADLARQMLAYSGKGHFVLQPLDLNQLVLEMTSMLEVSISKKAALRFDLAERIPAIVADPTQMRQIVMNLAINASEAIGDENGVISIATGCRHCDRAFLADSWLNDDLCEGAYVFLKVTDTGCGMDPETVGRIFEPFFTTKFTGRGLGMAAILGIVRGHKGAIKVESQPGQGTSFTIFVPASDLSVEQRKPAGLPAQWRGSGTVLLVDDEETVRQVGAHLLEELGFTVISAKDGSEALEVYRERRGEISLVLMDLTMPNLNGEETFGELRLIDPQVRVVLSSGFSEQEVTRKFLGKGLAGFVQKPYTLGTLRELMSTLA